MGGGDIDMRKFVWDNLFRKFSVEKEYREKNPRNVSNRNKLVISSGNFFGRNPPAGVVRS